MKSNRFYFLFLLLALLGGATALQARLLFVLPAPGANPPTLSMYNQDLVLRGTAEVPAEAFQVVLAPAGDRVFVLSRNAARPVTVLPLSSDAFVGEPRILQVGPNAITAQVTPDANRLVVLTSDSNVYVYNLVAGLEQLHSTIAVSGTPRDMAISLDSKLLWLITATSVIAVDIDTSQTRFVDPLTTPALSITAAPSGSIYVGADQRLIEYGGTATLGKIGEIVGNFIPGKLSFSSNGQLGVAPNRLAGSSSVVAFNLEERSTIAPAGTFRTSGTATEGGQVVNFETVKVISDQRAIGYASSTRRAYDITLPNLGVTLLSIGTVGGAPGGTLGAQDSLDFTEEFPATRRMFFLGGGQLGRFDISSNSAPTPLFANGSRLFVTPVVTDGRLPDTLYGYNNGQSVAGGSAVKPYVVRAVNNLGQPVRGTQFTISPETAGVTLGATSVFTNSEGLAQIPVTAPSTTGEFTVRAFAAGVTPVKEIRFTSTATSTGGGPPGGGDPGGRATIVKVGGDGQLLLGSAISDAIVVRLLDENGRPAVGRNVTFTGSEAVSVRTIDGSRVGLSVIVVTDAEGLAAAYMNAGVFDITQTGFREVRVTASSEYGNALFIANVFNVTGSQFDDTPILRLLKPIASEGNPGNIIRGKIGTRLVDAIQTSVTASYSGRPVPNAGTKIYTNFTDPELGPVAACEGGTVLSDANGIASCNVVISGRPGTTPLTVEIGSNAGPLASGQTGGGVFRLFLTADPAEPANIVIVRGNQQSGRIGDTLPIPLEARVLDENGSAMIGVPVQWTVVTPNSLTLQNQSGVTNAQGLASSQVRLGSNPGTYQVRLTAAPRSVTFTVTVLANVGSLTKISGDNQVTIINTAFGAPMVVEVRDTNGIPTANVNVAWTVSGGSASLSANTTPTGANGRAAVTVTAGPSPGAIAITATVAGQPSVTFNISSRLPGPLINPTSFTNLASGENALAPGTLVTIRGSGMAPGLVGTVSGDLLKGQLPLQLNQTTVEFTWTGGSSFAPIYSVTNQGGVEAVVVQVPFEISGSTASARVIARGGSTEVVGIPVRPYSPGILEDIIDGVRRGIVLRPDGSVVTPFNPGQRGEDLRAYVIGLGQTNPTAFTNQVGGLDQRVLATITVGLNYQGGVVLKEAKMARNLVGVYEVIFTVPANAPVGNSIPLSMSVDDPATNTRYFTNDTFIAIQ